MPSIRVPTNDDMTPDLLADVRARILARVDTSGPNGCWNWKPVLRNKYGCFGVGKLREYSHRWAYRAWNGPIPAAMQVCHKCDNPKCCNPEHLFCGTRSDNIQDAKIKGRLSTGPKHSALISGERSGAAKLTWRCVRAIRHLNEVCGLRAPQLATAFGVTPENITSILRHNTWKEST